MMIKFLLIGLLVALAVEANAKILPLGFYTTSRCHDTRNFIMKQLYPTYQDLGKYMTVDFIPWGKTKRLEDGSLKCQFFAADCKANRLQDCALSLIKKDSVKVDYMNCEFDTQASVAQDYKCVDLVGVSSDKVKACVDSEEGDRLQKISEEKTANITMVFVPTIVLNKAYDAEVQKAAYKDFRKFVCDQLKDENVPECM